MEAPNLPCHGPRASQMTLVMLADAKALTFLPQKTLANVIALRCCASAITGVAYNPQHGRFAYHAGKYRRRSKHSTGL